MKVNKVAPIEGMGDVVSADTQNNNRAEPILYHTLYRSVTRIGDEITLQAPTRLVVRSPLVLHKTLTQT